MMLHVVHHPAYVSPATDGQQARFDKYGLIMEQLAQSDAPMQLYQPEPMPMQWISAVHDAAYVEQVTTLSVPPEKERRIGFPVTERVMRRSLLSPGGTWLAARLALRHGYAANSAGGSHHALADTGAGYCIFNDLAITANRLIEEGDATRILILDLDVHQGDGTASLLAGRGDIFTLSVHAERNFPVRKARSTLDIGLPDETGDADYLAMLEDVVPAVLDDFVPDLILYQAGVDTHVDDRLGRLALSDTGLEARDHMVMRQARSRGISVASTVGGGYGSDRWVVARRHVACMLRMARSV